MDKGPPLPSKTKGQKSESAKDRILHTLENEPSLITGIIKALLVLGVGLGYFSDDLAGVMVSILTTLVVLLLSYIDREKSYGPRTVFKLLNHKP